MKMIYFQDVDTLEVVLREKLGPVAETVDGPHENILMDFGEQGRLVGLTIEDASRKTPLDELKSSPHFKTSDEAGLETIGEPV